MLKSSAKRSRRICDFVAPPQERASPGTHRYDFDGQGKISAQNLWEMSQMLGEGIRALLLPRSVAVGFACSADHIAALET